MHSRCLLQSLPGSRAGHFQVRITWPEPTAATVGCPCPILPGRALPARPRMSVQTSARACQASSGMAPYTASVVVESDAQSIQHSAGGGAAANICCFLTVPRVHSLSPHRLRLRRLPIEALSARTLHVPPGMFVPDAPTPGFLARVRSGDVVDFAIRRFASALGAMDCWCNGPRRGGGGGAAGARSERCRRFCGSASGKCEVSSRECSRPHQDDPVGREGLGCGCRRWGDCVCC